MGGTRPYSNRSCPWRRAGRARARDGAKAWQFGNYPADDVKVTMRNVFRRVIGRRIGCR
jgi:hypothetical protein